jgi:hypothetical protein
MQDNPSVRQCGNCRREIPAETVSSKTWILKEITDYKKRGFTEAGFPYGVIVTVEGWKLQDLSIPETVVCPGCVDKRLDELRENIAKEVRIAKIVAMIAGVIGLILVLLSIGYFILDPAFDWLEPPYLFFTVPAAIAVAVSAIAFLLYKYPDEPGDPEKELHRELMEHEVKSRKGLDEKQLDLVGLHMLHSECGKGTIAIDENERPDTYMSCGSWDVVRAIWVANSPAPGPPDDYPKSQLDERLSNMGFKTPGEFLEAGKHGEVV